MVLRGLVRLSRISQGLPTIRQSCPSARVVSLLPTPFHRLASSTSDRVPWYERLPITLRPSFWGSMIPKPFRKEARQERRKSKNQQPVKRWNPATYFILIFMLIGSFGIHFINLRQRYAFDSRQAENRIAMLQEVLRRVQAGEDVDVEKMLGTGDPMAEQEWEEGKLGWTCCRVESKADLETAVVIKHIEEEDRLWQSKERKKARKQARKEAREAAEAAMAAENSPKTSDQFAKTTNHLDGDDEHSSRTKRTPGFY